MFLLLKFLFGLVSPPFWVGFILTVFLKFNVMKKMYMRSNRSQMFFQIGILKRKLHCQIHCTFSLNPTLTQNINATTVKIRNHIKTHLSTNNSQHIIFISRQKIVRNRCRSNNTPKKNRKHTENKSQKQSKGYANY